MAASQIGSLIQYLRHAGMPRDGLSDGELLAAFLARRDEAAFSILVRRHAPMVLSVCRRVLRNAADAEDAVQATFIVLVRKAASLRQPERLGNWLYGPYSEVLIRLPGQPAACASTCKSVRR